MATVSGSQCPCSHTIMSEQSAWCGNDSIIFTLNGQIQKVSSVPGDLSLNTYIREYAGLKGTKFMCREGGCGICIVSLQFTHPVTCQENIVSVNSCMFPVLACHGLRVTTVEGIGSRKTGYSEIQTRLAHFNGTQCGYCSPGWVMSMYSLLRSNPNATMKEVEDSLSGNLCRCTGYRPILDAFKSFASDRSNDLQNKIADIEDLLKVCTKSGTICHGKCKLDKTMRDPYDCLEKNNDDGCTIEFVEVALASPSLQLNLNGGAHWYKVTHVDEIFEIFDMISGPYRLVGGNTAIGILKGLPKPDVFIDINGVSFLKAHSMGSKNLYVGANTTLTDAIVLFRAIAVENPVQFSYTEQLARHIEKVANTPVRNVGTLAGNLSIKHAAREYQSDIFLILETVGAQLSIRGQNQYVRVMSLAEYLDTDMYKEVILQIVLPAMDPSTNIVKTYKISPRAENAVATVNGGFMFKVDRKDGFRVLSKPTIVFGNINPIFIHADQTERFLVGRKLLDVSTLQKALHILGKEVQPDYKLPDSTPQYRRGLALALLYRVVLSLDPNSVRAQFRSGGEDISRPLSSGRQEFDTNSSRPPLYQPFPKVESLIQCSGEAEFIYDIPIIAYYLHAAFVITRIGPAVLGSLDPSRALKIPGVVAFFSAKDIPGKNCFTPTNSLIPDDEQLFADKNILFAGQCVGMVVAQTQELADVAADLVQIVYKSKEKPVLDLREVVRNKDRERMFLRVEQEATTIKPDVRKVVQGDFQMNEQYNFPMEMLTCLTVPTEDGQELDVFCSTQWQQVVNEAISILLNIPQNRINMKLRRLGGSYGIKVTRGNIVGGACSLAAYLLQRPVRMVVKLETMMEAIGKRHPTLLCYEAGVNDEGAIQYLNTRVYVDVGSSFNEPIVPMIAQGYTNVYDSSTWSTKMYDVKTDKPSNVWVRAPGTLEGVTIAEVIMEHIAHEVGRDPLSVRMKNLNQQYPIQSLLDMIKEKSDMESRKQAVELFNKENVWKKRGISLVPMRYFISLINNYHATISVFSKDGTVSISHGGIEMGQGINTKAAQVFASAFAIPLDTVVVKPSDLFISPNDIGSGASLTSETVCAAVERCCEELNRRLEPFRIVGGSQTWVDLIQAANSANIDLKVSYMFAPKQGDMKEYNVFGATVLEVEVDILTGEHKIIRVDVLEDAGKSLNPFVDVGQIEGAFILGLGYWTFEQVIKDPNTGRTLTNRTLTYKIPGPKDIPIDFRVYILKNADNPLGVLGSKSVGEPPVCTSSSIMFAIKQALRSARADFQLSNQWLNIVPELVLWHSDAETAVTFVTQERSWLTKDDFIHDCKMFEK